MVKCPCHKCLVYPLCKNKTIQSLMVECELLTKFLVERYSNKGVVLNRDALNEFCDVMDIILKKSGNNTTLSYKGRVPK